MTAAMGKGEAEAILGLDQPYTKKALKAASRKAILRWHPDRAVRNGVPEEVANRKFDESQKATKTLEALFDGKPDNHKVTPDPVPKRSTGGGSSSSKSSAGSRSAGASSSSTNASDSTATGSGGSTDASAAPGSAGGWADTWASNPTSDADDTTAEGVGKDSPVPEKASAMCHNAAQKVATIHFAFLIISAVLAAGGIYDGFQSTSHANTAFVLGVVLAGVFAAELFTRIPSRVFAAILEHYACQVDARKLWARLIAYAFYCVGKIVIFLCLALHAILGHFMYGNGNSDDS